MLPSLVIVDFLGLQGYAVDMCEGKICWVCTGVRRWKIADNTKGYFTINDPLQIISTLLFVFLSYPQDRKSSFLSFWIPFSSSSLPSYRPLRSFLLRTWC